ncbi:MAG: CCA tRNA nucleotidyltransferase [Actinobacteria bacterium]|nr:MAG: CCA tRNA nucleotidyltransferase [Actinomycetota bacterium]
MAAEGVLDRLGADPAGKALLRLAGDRGDVHVVGGYVRDALLDRPAREIDVLVEGDALTLAQALAAELGASVERHERFGTALVRSGAGQLDLATARRERYPQPGALPEVSLGASVPEDLRRRDFTVNAIAVQVGGAEAGRVRGAEHALDDLQAGVLRVLHDASFSDDPTRLLRLARYARRLGFAPEAHTLELARAAIDDDALARVSGPRQGAELRLALTEPDAVATLQSLAGLGLLAALHPGLRCDEALARRALALLPEEGRPELVVLSACATGFSEAATLIAWLDALEFPARDRHTVCAAALGAGPLAARLATAGSASELYAVASGRTIEQVALAGALDPAAATAARRWLSELRHVTLEIDGDDLIEAGIPAGPEIGRRLREALAAKLDGAADGREGELRAALDA